MFFRSNDSDRHSGFSNRTSATAFERNSLLGFNSNSKASATLSVNLNNTIGDTSLMSVRSLNVPTKMSMPHFSSNASSGGSIRSYPSIRNLETSVDKLSIYNTTIGSNNQVVNRKVSNGSILSNYISENESSNNGQENLMDLLAESMYSYTPSDIGVEGYRRPIVSNELPDIFNTGKQLKQENDNELGKQDKNFFILSSAGKPIFIMHGDDKQVIPLAGIINTVINYFQVNEQTNVKTIYLRKTGQRFVFLNKSPIIIMIYSRQGETTNVLQDQLDFLYSYLLSTLTSKNLAKLFKNRSNFDLGTFLAQTDVENLNEICSLLSNQFYPDIFLNALQSNPLKKTIRAKIHNQILQQLNEDSELIPRGTLLYGLLLTGKDTKMTAVIRPRGHTLHTSDLQLLFCLIRRHFRSNNTDRELWIPICFPKFNSTGFLYSYIKFLSYESKTVLVFISAQKDAFFKLKLFSDRLTTKLINDRSISKVIDSDREISGFRIRDIQAPLIHHFIYKSKRHVQYIMPTVEYNVKFQNILEDEEIYESSHSGDENNGNINFIKDEKAYQQLYQMKLQSYYRELHNSIMTEDGRESLNNTVVNFINWEGILSNGEDTYGENPYDEHGSIFTTKEKIHIMGMVWSTPQFELYLICNNGVNDKKTISSSARKILRWCQKYEERLFIQNGAIF
ncbi:vacuolar fusion protein Mon1p [Monosporozyma unispora]